MAKWLHKIKKTGQCTGSNYGGPRCRPGTRQYAFAKRARSGEFSKKKEEGGTVPDFLFNARKQAIINKIGEEAYLKKYPFGGAINKGISKFASALGASPENAQLYGSIGSTLTGLIPGMQDNLLQGADLIGDIGVATDNKALQQVGSVANPLADIAGLFTGDQGQLFGKLGKVPIARHGGDPRYAQFHNLSQDDYNKAIINVEKDELEVKGGKVLTDYKAKPRHPEDENEIDFYGNTLAKPGNIIIPRDKREAYLKGDKITRNTIEVQLRRDQNKREKEELGELRSRDRYLKSLRGNVEKYISRTGQEPVSGQEFSVFPPQYRAGLKELGFRYGGGVPDFYGNDLLYGLGGCIDCHQEGGSVLPDFLYKARGRAMRKANPGYFQGGGLVEKAPAYEDEFGYQNYVTSQLADYYGKSQAGYNVPQYSPAISTAQTKFDPFYNPGTANFGINKTTTDTGRNLGFSDFAQYTAPAYNLATGLLGRTPETEAYQNPYAERVKEIMGGRRINMQPIQEGIGLASAGAKRQLRGLTGGSAPLQLEGMRSIQNIEARNRAEAAMKEQIANLGLRGEEAGTLDILGQQDVQARERQRQLQLAMEANRAQFVPKGLEQFSAISQARNKDQYLKQLLKLKGII